MTELKKSKKRVNENVKNDEGQQIKKAKSAFIKGKPKFDGKFKGQKDFKKFQKPTKEPEKTNWNELKKQKKELKIRRKINKSKDMYDLDVKAKKIYEELKMGSTKSNKEELCQQLYKLFKDVDYSKLSQSPDRARIIQMMLKKASQKIKNEIAEKLIPYIVEVALSKYGKFCVSRLMTYCDKEVREKAVAAMLSNIVKLTNHKLSNGLIDIIFLNHASPVQKNFMKQELYSDLYKKDKNKNVKTISDTWKDSEMMKNGILNSTKINLMKYASKNLVDNSLVHAVLLEFLENADEKNKNEVITAYIPHLSAIASTKAGARAAILCYLQSVAKERRAMLKTIKEHVFPLCIHEHGHVLILEILNSTDDTLNIKKTIFPSLIKNIEDIVSSEYGKRVIYFIVSPTKEFLHPKTLEELNKDLKLGTQKKDADIRQKELVEAIENELCGAIKNNARFWVQGGHIARVTCAILQNSTEKNKNLADAFDSLSEVICDPEWMVNEIEITHGLEDLKKKKEESVDTGKIKKKKKNPLEKPKVENEQKLIKGIEHSGLHIAIKKIVKLKDFAKSFLAHFSENVLNEWIKINRACFVINEIFEHADEESKLKIKELLTSVKERISSQSHAAGFCIFVSTFIECFRIYSGYAGNINSNLLDTTGFLILSVVIQLPIHIYLTISLYEAFFKFQLFLQIFESLVIFIESCLNFHIVRKSLKEKNLQFQMLYDLNQK
ncbi:hypothetical protein PVAND_002512 [Polypedilum vanderplanki]|uniref:PUM-HD domain-containing protein n=1 Tax=Polypedilum vanderplanki TaxID=319348 RepID=A0A9J6BR84_POLVA|nr:hypothetical protein PVAND_002512 [Polypedilum vanderplanki]